MKLNHINLQVPDPQRTAEYFTRFFGLKVAEEKGKNTLIVLFDDGGLALTVSNLSRETTFDYPRDFHIGFLQHDRAGVEALYEQLIEEGCADGPPRSMHGSWGFYLTAPDGIVVEVSYPVDGAPDSQSAINSHEFRGALWTSSFAMDQYKDSAVAGKRARGQKWLISLVGWRASEWQQHLLRRFNRVAEYFSHFDCEILQ